MLGASQVTPRTDIAFVSRKPITSEKETRMTPLNKQPKYLEAFGELTDLNGALAKVQTRIVEIESQLQRWAPGGSDSSHVAAALKFASTGKVHAADNTPNSLREEHLALRQQHEALAKVVEQRNQALVRLRQELSHAACREMGSEHRKLAARARQKLLELDAIAVEEEVLIHEISNAGYDAYFPERVYWPHI
jgi:hypothetical protein